MNNDQMSLLRAALERAAATMRGGMQPPNFDMTGMFNPEAMASQGQPGMQLTPNAQVDARFGGMQPPAQMSPNQYVAQNFPGPSANEYVAQNFPQQQPSPPQMAQSTPMPQPRPQQAPQPQEMGFFQRNAAMMQDPVMGGFIDPGAAAQAQASSPANINKMLGMLFNKANG
jgi:hypothetical protein